MGPNETSTAIYVFTLGVNEGEDSDFEWIGKGAIHDFIPHSTDQELTG
jgi:hypothetical protein